MPQTFWKWVTNFDSFSLMAVGMPLPLLTEQESQVRRGLGVLWIRGWVLGEQRQLQSWDLRDSWLASWLAGVSGRVETKEFPKSLCLSLSLPHWICFPGLLTLTLCFLPSLPLSLITPVVSSIMSTTGTFQASPSVCQHTASHNQKWRTQRGFGTQALQSPGAELEMETLWLCWHYSLVSRACCGGQEGIKGSQELPRRITGAVTFPLCFAEFVTSFWGEQWVQCMRSMSLNNFSHLRFEQSTKVFKLSFRLPENRALTRTSCHKRKSAHF